MKDKEARQLIKEFVERYPTAEPTLKSASVFEELAVNGNYVFFVDGKPLILRTQAGVLPSLKFEEFINTLPRIVVDMGAISHVTNGAQIMRPGIKQFKDGFASGSLVVIVDEKYGKSIALGRADMDSKAMQSQTKGRVVTNLHYVGDDYWKAFTNID